MIHPNCLTYALHFWNNNRHYKCVYNSDHVINVPIGTYVNGFEPLKSFGHCNLSRAFRELLTEQDLELLKEYLEYENTTSIHSNNITNAFIN